MSWLDKIAVSLSVLAFIAASMGMYACYRTKSVLSYNNSMLALLSLQLWIADAILSFFKVVP